MFEDCDLLFDADEDGWNTSVWLNRETNCLEFEQTHRDEPEDGAKVVLTLKQFRQVVEALRLGRHKI